MTGVTGRIAWEYLERIHPTISVGANELQRDSIARAAFAREATTRETTR